MTPAGGWGAREQSTKLSPQRTMVHARWLVRALTLVDWVSRSSLWLAGGAAEEMRLQFCTTLRDQTSILWCFSSEVWEHEIRAVREAHRPNSCPKRMLFSSLLSLFFLLLFLYDIPHTAFNNHQTDRHLPTVMIHPTTRLFGVEQ